MKKILYGSIVFLIILTPVVVVSMLPNSIPLPEKKSPEIIRIAAVNLNYTNPRAKEVAEALLQTGFDLLIGLECTGKNININRLKKKGYRVVLDYPRRGTHGICIIAKQSLPLTTKVVSSPVAGPCAIPIGTARLQLKERYIVVLGVHAPPPISTCKGTTIPTLETICSWVRDGVLQRDVGAGEAGDIVVIAGDFNMYPFHPVFHRFKEAGLKDVFRVANWRLGLTWRPVNWLPPMVRIDYILTGKHFKIVNAYVFNIPGSDHRGVAGDLMIN